MPIIKDPKHCALAEIADLLNLSRARILQLVTDGVLPKGARGKYPIEDCVRAYVRFLQDNAGKRHGSGEATASRLRLLKAKATAEIELAVLEDKYAPVEDLSDVMESEYGLVKERLLGISAKCLPMLIDLAGMHANKIHDRIRDELLEALGELSGGELEDDAA
jgi:hypothetical protein